MDADLDLLCVSVYVTADDLLPGRPAKARRKLTDAEIVTLCVRRRSGARCWLDQELVRLVGCDSLPSCRRGFPVLRPALPDPRSGIGGSIGMLADEVDYVVGVDTHRDQHVLAVVAAPAGAVVAQRSVAASGRGYGQALRFANQYAAGSRVWAVEGVGPLRRRPHSLPERPRRSGA